MTRDIPRIQKELQSDQKSRLAKYSDLVVGRRGFWSLLKYEFVVAFSAMPGALGLALRSVLYPRLLKRCGRNVVFGANVVLRHPNKIAVGDNVIIDDNVLLDAKGSSNEGIVLGDGVFIGRNSILSCKNGDIVFGENVNIGFNSEVFSSSRVTLGANVMLAAYCYIIGGDHEYNQIDVPVTEQAGCSQGITVGEGAWFGAGAKVLDGTKIGPHAIVGAGAVVTRDIPEYAVAVGVPAKVVKDRRTESRP